MDRINELIDWFEPHSQVLVALSGGVDSGLVAYAAFEKLGAGAIAVTADYKTLSGEELDTARRVCKEIGIRQVILDYNELENAKFAENDSDRCFYCRTELGMHLDRLARQLGIGVIVDGTNLDDLGDYRPGIEALRQYNVQSPLLDAGFTKSDVRTCAKNAGLSIHDKPSNSCLASRIPWGQRVTAEKLVRIEMAETVVKQLTGISQVRVRDMDGCAKIEVERGMIPALDKLHGTISEKLKMFGFTDVRVDPDGYRPGKINVVAD